MVIGVSEVRLYQVVVNVAYGKLCLYPVDTNGLKFKVCHGACGVLGKGLVYLYGNRLARAHLALNNVGGDDLFCNV